MTDIQLNSPGDKKVYNHFPALTGFLLAIVLPIIWVLLDGNVITRENIYTLYYQTIIILSFLFFICFFSLWWIRDKSIILSNFLVGYTILVLPFTFVFLALTVNHVLLLTTCIKIVFIFHLIYLVFGWFGCNSTFTRPVFLKINRWIIYLMPVGFAGVFWPWLLVKYRPVFNQSFDNEKIMMGLMIIFASIALIYLLSRNIHFLHYQWRSQSSWIIYPLVLLLLIGIIYRPNLYFDRFHYNYFLAPVNDILNGKSLFVNSTSQYGFWSVYFIAFLFGLLKMPVFYTGFSLIICILFVFYYLVIFVTLHKTTDNLVLSLIGIAAIVYFNYLSVYWPSMLHIPAQSPLRYGLSYLILILALIESNRKKRVWLYLELILLGIASLWSLETFIYTFVPLTAFYLFKDVFLQKKIKSGLKMFFKHLLFLLITVLVSWSTIYLYFHISGKQEPNLVFYFEYFRAYTTADQYSYSMDFHSLWSGIVTAVYLLSIYFVIFIRFTGGKELPRILSWEKASMIVSISVLGILQYTYYFVYDIDYHLALLSVPLIIVLIMWAAILKSNDVPRLFRFCATTTMTISFLLCAVISLPHFREKITMSLLGNVISRLEGNTALLFSDPFNVLPTNKNVSDLVTLIQKYASDQQQIAVFAKPDDETEALLLTHKTHGLNISDPSMTAISPSYSEYVLNTTEENAGTPFIFYDQSKGALIDLQTLSFQILTMYSDYRVIDRAGNIVVFKRLGAISHDNIGNR